MLLDDDDSLNTTRSTALSTVQVIVFLLLVNRRVSPFSNSDDEWDALLDAHGLAPSLGGTAAAVAQPADAAGASRRARDKRRRRQRKAAKRSMWRDI